MTGSDPMYGPVGESAPQTVCRIVIIIRTRPRERMEEQA